MTKLGETKTRGRFILLVILISGCIGPEINPDGSSLDTNLFERNLSKIALNSMDLGFGAWVQSSENVTEDVIERRFVRVEPTFGGISRLVNRIHLYPSPEKAMGDYQAVEKQLKESFRTKNPGVGEISVLYITDGGGYLLFKRDNMLVEIEYTTTGRVEEELLVGVAQTVDSKITG